MRVFENRVLRRIYGPKTEDVGGTCRKIHNEEIIMFTLLLLLLLLLLCDQFRKDETGLSCNKHEIYKNYMHFSRKT
jgi:hypothetical protein